MNLINFIKVRGLHRTTVEIALDLIYAATEQQFPVEKIDLWIPRAIDVRPDLETDPNTFIGADVDGEYDDRYGPPTDDGFLYRRLPLSILLRPANLDIDLPETFPFTTHDILPQLNIALNAQLTVNDVLNDEYTSIEDVLQVRAHPQSLAWIGALVIERNSAVGGRLLEDNTLRVTEDGTVRALETETV